MPVFDHDGKAVRLRERGAGPLAVFLHCALAHGGAWREVSAALDDARRTVALDMPGHGWSDPPKKGVGLQASAASAALGVILARGEGAVDLVGHSSGASAAARAALERPDLVRSLTLIEPVAFGVLRKADPDAFAEEDAAFGAVRAAHDAGKALSALRLFVDRWGAPGGFEALGREGRDQALAALRHVVEDAGPVMGETPDALSAEAIAGFPGPLMLITGAETLRTARGVVDAIAAARPAARVEIIAGAGHMSPLTHPDAVTGALRDFWSAIG